MAISTSNFRIDGRTGRQHVAHCILTGEMPVISTHHRYFQAQVLPEDTQADSTDTRHRDDTIQKDTDNKHTATLSVAPNFSSFTPSEVLPSILSVLPPTTQHLDGPHWDRVGDYSTEPNTSRLELKE